ncbi:hypothetical protein KY290_036560 [Solanum tuberosum]|uniref:Uncharacterized protein n=1 Tax=Solanum tuberosum TaxID=4113 RepID=A0ABQ7TWS7_SOLTU|nr:hypothetical protein KY289_036047 [Solanum tuberosum]KAH0639287.1 hypothetical protein KY285_035873 [Solanum tuberosum]KAH0737855.1 hypothetical protein KY290_036560 [Solanum tuberosum]
MEKNMSYRQHVSHYLLKRSTTRERAQSFTNVGSPRRCAGKRTLNGKNKDSRNTEYDPNELTQDDLTLPQDEVEVKQDTQRSSCESDKIKNVRGPNFYKVVTGLKSGETLKVTFYHNRIGPQRKSHVVGFGGGITSKDLKGGSSAKDALLEQLNVSKKEKAALLEERNANRKENESIKRRIDNIKKRCEIFESAIF